MSSLELSIVKFVFFGSFFAGVIYLMWMVESSYRRNRKAEREEAQKKKTQKPD